MNRTNNAPYLSFLTSFSKLKVGKKSRNTKTQEIEVTTKDVDGGEDGNATGKYRLPSLLERSENLVEREKKQPAKCDSDISSNVRKEKTVMFETDGIVLPTCDNIVTSNNAVSTPSEKLEELDRLAQHNPKQKLNSLYSSPPAVPLRIISAQPSKVSDKKTNKRKSKVSFNTDSTAKSAVETLNQTQNSTSSKVETFEKVNSCDPKDCSSEDVYIWKDLTFLFADLAFRTHWLLREIIKHLERQNELLRNELGKVREENSNEHCCVDSNKLDMIERRVKTLEELVELKVKPKTRCLKTKEVNSKGDLDFSTSPVSTANTHYVSDTPGYNDEKVALLTLVIDGLVLRMQRLEEWHRNSSLVFYGVPGDFEETPTSSADRVAQVLKKALKLQIADRSKEMNTS
ncbi:uncharacterized protein LOC143224864 isoform X2 [Tachypleus tridentatus]|uniref:uncharacterized protein LOC143224864 isoform X2 n=1 Tax=Tachypleus tridentatus TaxID=6853 RepID=UPI003FD296B7